MTKIASLPMAFDLKPYTQKELAGLYGLTTYIMRKWLKAMQPELGLPIAYRYTVKQVEMILARYGIPGHFVYEKL